MKKANPSTAMSRTMAPAAGRDAAAVVADVAEAASIVDARTESLAEPERHVEAAPAPRVEAKPEPRADSRNESRNDFRSESRSESRPRQDYGPPAGYTPIILPGESISKYRNMPQPAAEAPSAVDVANDGVASMPVEDFIAPETKRGDVEEIQEESIHLDQGYEVTETETSSRQRPTQTKTDRSKPPLP